MTKKQQQQKPKLFKHIMASSTTGFNSLLASHFTDIQSQICKNNREKLFISICIFQKTQCQKTYSTCLNATKPTKTRKIILIKTVYVERQQFTTL